MGFTLFGLTGGIACGKSTVAGFLRKRGLPVIDADALARQVVAPGSEGLRRIIDAFGKDVVDASGALNRKKLGAIVFDDPAARETLEKITHPRIRRRTREVVAKLVEEGHVLAAYEAALLVESHLVESFRPLVVVALDPKVQLSRVMERDHLTEHQAQARLASQLPIEKKVAVADYVIDTDTTLESVDARTGEVLEKICASLDVKDGRCCK